MYTNPPTPERTPHARLGVLQVFFTYTPGVQDVFSNSNIDGIVWGYILGLMASIFVLIDIEKTYGPKLFMPWFRKRFGLCLPTPDDVGYMDEKEQVCVCVRACVCVCVLVLGVRQ